MKRITPPAIVTLGIVLSVGAFSLLWLAVSPAFANKALQQILEVYS